MSEQNIGNGKKSWRQRLTHRFFIWLSVVSLLSGGVYCLIKLCWQSEIESFQTTSLLEQLLLASLIAAIVISMFYLWLWRWIGCFLGWFARWFFRWRTFKRLMIALGCLFILIILAYVEENWRGKRDWEKFKREWEAKGEKFDLKSLAPPPIPDDQNFAMAPLLRPIFDYVITSNSVLSLDEEEDQFQRRDSNNWARLKNIDAYLPMPDITTNPIAGSLYIGRFADLDSFRAFYLGNTHYPQPAESKSAAEDILVALGKFDRDFEELDSASQSRPLCRFPVDYDHEPPTDIQIPHLRIVKDIVSCAAIRISAYCELGRAKEALNELNLCFRLADSIQSEPILISHLVRDSVLTISLQATREGLRRHTWDDTQLKTIQQRLASINLFAECRQALRGERASMIDTVEYIRRKKWDSNNTPWIYLDSSPHMGLRDFLFHFTPSGWFWQNELTVARIEQKTIDTMDVPNRKVDVQDVPAADFVAGELRHTPYSFLARMLVPSISNVIKRSARTQTYVDAARVACALERYRLANGALPKSLGVLAPTFIDAIPADVIDGKPLRYRLIGDDQYIIYSVGWNQTDDGGDWAWHDPEKKLGADPNEGDCIWSSAAP